MDYTVTVLPQQQEIPANAGEDLLSALRRAGLGPDAPCGGKGSCGKCRVNVDGEQVLACRTPVDRDMTVTLLESKGEAILSRGISGNKTAGARDGCVLALDIGTTTVVGYLLDGKTGRELAAESMGNPQAAFGGDVISRIGSALAGNLQALTGAIRSCVETITGNLCRKAGIEYDQISVVSLVGNPAMQQLFLGISPENLAKIPFAPVLTEAKEEPAGKYLPIWGRAKLLTVPDISGFVGADTVACLLATELFAQEEMTLLVDIGTNGEMVLGNQRRMVACSTAAGPALEGANIQFGMRARRGAIDRVWMEKGQLRCSVIGGVEAEGICGSGLIDGVAAALSAGLLNSRGRIQNEDRVIRLTENICLTQEDIRQVQLAKGAIAAGIRLMADHLGIGLKDIQRVYLAGAFGTFLDPAAACGIGLLPCELEGKITAVGNAAGSGAKLLALDPAALAQAENLTKTVEFLELAALPEFQGCFARCMRFDPVQNYWIQRALYLGFSVAAPLDPATLLPRQDVRDMCAADTCRAYGKNWTCPPHCGSLEACAAKMQGYRQGILLQTVGKMEKDIDTKAYRRTEQQHLEQFHKLAQQLRQAIPNALCLGSGGCRICKSCAYPEPCRFPEEACPSMEGYGLFVTQVCRDNGVDYYHGPRTVTYTACVLF